MAKGYETNKRPAQDARGVGVYDSVKAAQAAIKQDANEGSLSGKGAWRPKATPMRRSQS
jgi:hypothetical protein